MKYFLLSLLFFFLSCEGINCNRVPYNDQTALSFLKTLPDYEPGNPRIVSQLNTSHWTSGVGLEIIREMARIGGAVNISIASAHRYLFNQDYIDICETTPNCKIVLTSNAIGGLDTWRPIEELNADYIHDLPHPWQDYINHMPSVHGLSRILYSPARESNQEQVSRWYSVAQDIASQGLNIDDVDLIWVHDETAYVAQKTDWYVKDELYTDSVGIGSKQAYNQILADLHERIIHAHLEGMGDLDHSTKVMYWSGGYRWIANKQECKASPWLPIEDYPDTPHQDYWAFANYSGASDSVDDMRQSYACNAEHSDKPVVPFISLTYNNSAECDQWLLEQCDSSLGACVRELCGIDYNISKLKAQLAAEMGSPYIFLYALNPMGQYSEQMDNDWYRKQFLTYKYIVEGSRL